MNERRPNGMAGRNQAGAKPAAAARKQQRPRGPPTNSAMQRIDRLMAKAFNSDGKYKAKAKAFRESKKRHGAAIKV